MDNSKYAAVICLYNPQEKDIYNIFTYIDFFQTVYLIDNSDNDNADFVFLILDKYKKKIIYVPMLKNSGIAHALNTGIKMAITDGFEWIMTLDQDTGFLNNVIGIFHKYITSHKNGSIAILAPQYVCDRKPVKMKDRKNHKREVQQKRWVIQSGMLINTKIFQSIGELNEKLFLDGADRDYCLRVIKQKYKICAIDTALIRHEPGQSRTKKVGNRIVKYGWHPPERYYYQTYSYWLMFTVYHDIESLFWILYKFFKVIFLFDEKKKYCISGIRGILDAQKDISLWKE